MAQGKPLGTVFVELDLDATKFSAAQKRIIKDAGVVTKEVEKNYSTLGIKSSAMYDAMRLQAENAYQGILHSSRSTANDLVRAEQAKAAKITAINEQQFGKQVSMMDRLRSGWLGMASMAVAGGLLALGRSALQMGDDIAKASEKLGIGAEKLSAMKYAADMSDVSFEALQKGMKKFSQAITEAEGKGTDAATAFSAMGIATKDAAGKTLPLDALFGKVADRFAAMEDGAGKVSLAVALFGRAGMDMIPVLNKGAAGMAAMEAEAGRLGATISGKTAKQLEEANDNLKSMWASVKGITASITGGLLGAIKSMGDAFGESLGNMDGGFAFSSAARTFKAPASPAKTTAPNLDAMKEAAKERKRIEDEYQKIHAANVMAEGKIVHDNLADEMGWSQEYYDSVTKMRISDFDDWKKQQAEEAALLEKFELDKIHGMKELQDAQRAEFEDTGTPMAAYGFEDAMKAAEAYGNVSLAIQTMNSDLGTQYAMLAEGQSYIDTYKQAWLDANLAIADSVRSLYSGMTNWISSSLQGLIEGTMGVMDVMKNLGSMMLSIITEYVAKWLVSRMFMAAMGKTFQATEVAAAMIAGPAIAAAYAPAAAMVSLATLGANSAPAMTGIGATVGLAQMLSLPKLAEGGIVDRPTIALIGEKGPEAVVPLDKGGGSGQPINLYLDGEVLAQWFHKAGRSGQLVMA